MGSRKFRSLPLKSRQFLTRSDGWKGVFLKESFRNKDSTLFLFFLYMKESGVKKKAEEEIGKNKEKTEGGIRKKELR